jgi:hypothetical protein
LEQLLVVGIPSAAIACNSALGGVLTDFMNQWYLIWIGGEGEVFYACTEVNSTGDVNPLSRNSALYNIQKHLEKYNQLLNDQKVTLGSFLHIAYNYQTTS